MGIFPHKVLYRIHLPLISGPAKYAGHIRLSAIAPYWLSFAYPEGDLLHTTEYSNYSKASLKHTNIATANRGAVLQHYMYHRILRNVSQIQR